MTTIIAIKANSGVEGIVLGADRQLSYYENERIIKKESIRKIKSGKNWITAYSGGVSNQFAIFQNYSDQKMIKEINAAVKNYLLGPGFKGPHFRAINYINTIAKRNGAELDCLHELVLAAEINNNIDLWEVDVFGNLKQPQKTKEFEYLSAGSGSDVIEGYINELLEQGKINQCKITLPKAIDIIKSSLNKAEQKDPNTGWSMDLAVLTKEGVDFYSDSLYEVSIKAIDNFLQTVKDKYK
ncbi:MAG: hypothetical protein KKA62_04160 [Nanoarchaeota archaeon]|nr:hypothetical protein [Nanoarchaeota archaeon]MBU1644530.1 hypothetical protein [Nanoarchaeota archaeon]MBU1977118.1 hypothetical protein [Nanoarchaeota archaeon]